MGDGPTSLGGTSGGGARGGAVFDADSVWVKIPVLVVSGAAAVVMAVPAVAGGLVRIVRERFGRGGCGGGGGARSFGRGSSGGSGSYTSRGAFARARGREQDYSVVSGDEDDLLGDDLSEDDV